MKNVSKAEKAYRSAVERYSTARQRWQEAKTALVEAEQRQKRLVIDRKFDRFESLAAEAAALRELDRLQRSVPKMRRAMDDALLLADDGLTATTRALSEWRAAVDAHNQDVLVKQREAIAAALKPSLSRLSGIDTRSADEVVDAVMRDFRPRSAAPLAVVKPSHLPDGDVITMNARSIRHEQSRARGGQQTAPVDPIHCEIQRLRAAVA